MKPYKIVQLIIILVTVIALCGIAYALSSGSVKQSPGGFMVFAVASGAIVAILMIEPDDPEKKDR